MKFCPNKSFKSNPNQQLSDWDFLVISNGNDEVKAMQVYMNNGYKIPTEVKPGVKELFNENSELANIGTPQQYTSYLDTIFPESQVKDIVYHGSPIKNLQEIKRGDNNHGKMYTSRYGITFTDNDLTAMIYAGQIAVNPEMEDNLDNGQVYPVLLNIKNPQIQDFNNESYGGKFGSAIGTYNNALEKAFKDSKDAFIAKRIADPVQNQTNIVVFKPEQIHILGSKQDIEGFKEFVENTTMKLPAQLSLFDSTFATNPKYFINRSGGADGGDINWDEIGRKFGFVNHVHYYTGLRSKFNAPFGNQEIKPEDVDYKEGVYESAKAAERNYGYTYKTMSDERLIRNWSQVKHADAIFAISNIVDTGEILFPNIKDDTRRAKVPAVAGGTGYAVGMSINHRKPVYVFNQIATKKYPIGWYEWDYQENDFVTTDTPVLTTNFAGIGSRQTTDKGKQAIRDVYAATLQKITANNIKEKTEEVANENYKSLEELQQDQERFEKIKQVYIIEGLSNNEISTVVASCASNIFRNYIKIILKNDTISVSKDVEKNSENKFLAIQKKKLEELIISDVFRGNKNKLQLIIDNWDLVSEQIRKKLATFKKVGLQTNESRNSSAEADSDTEDVSENPLRFSKDKDFKINQKSNTTVLLRQFLLNIEAKEKDGRGTIKAKVNSVTGLKEFVNFDELYGDLKSLLANVPPNLNLQLKYLQQFEKSSRLHFAQLRNLLGKSEEDLKYQEKVKNEVTVTTEIKNQFEKHMAGQYADMTISITGDYMASFSSADFSLKRKIFSEWQNSMIENNIIVEKEIKVNKEGNEIITYRKEYNKKKFEKYIKLFESLKLIAESESNRKKAGEVDNQKTISTAAVLTMLNSIGINLDADTIRYLKVTDTFFIGKKRLKFEAQFTSKFGIFNVLNNIATKIVNQTEETDKPYDPVENNILNDGIFKSILGLEKIFNTTIRSETGVLVDKEKYYTIMQNSYLSETFRNLKTAMQKDESKEWIEELSLFAFKSNSDILEAILENNYRFNNVSLGYADGLIQKNENTNIANRAETFDNNQYELYSYIQFITGARVSESDGTRYANFVLPTISDKSKLAIMKDYPLYNVTFKNGKLSKETMDKIFFKMVYPEIKRMIEYSKRKDLTKIKGYKEGQSYFYSFPVLNELRDVLIIDGELNEAALTENMNLIYSKIRRSVMKAIEIKAKNIFDLYDVKGKSSEISSNEESLAQDISFDSLEKSYIKTVESLSNGVSNIDYIAADMVINTMLVNTEFQKLFGEDPALHYKKGKNGSVESNIEATLINLGKRMSGISASGLNTDIKKKVKILFAADTKVPSKHLDYYKENLKDKPKQLEALSNIDRTDAVEWQSVDFYLSEQHRIGRITHEQSADLIDRAKKGTLTDQELAGVFKIEKYVHNQVLLNTETLIAERYYIKSASIPLIPQLYGDNFEIKAIAEMMNRTNIDTIVFPSTVKIGAIQTPFALFDENGNLKDLSHIQKSEHLNDYTRTISLANRYLQVETPYDKHKYKATEGSQQQILIFNNILGINNFNFNTRPKSALSTVPVNHTDEDGFSYYEDVSDILKTGKELLEIYTKHYQQLYTIKLRRFQHEIKLHYKNGKAVFDEKKLGDIITQEAIDRDYSINDIESLGLELHEGIYRFKIPLFMSNNSDRLQFVLASITDKALRSLKMPGKSLVLASEAGIKTLVNSVDDLNAKQKSLIIWDKSFDRSKGLKKDEIIIPCFFVDQTGKKIDIRNYTYEDENGNTYIDDAKFPPELRETFCFRIPTQSHSSMAAVKIVGFFPDMVGDMIVASQDFVAQMGQDFDLDKMYVYNYNVNSDIRISEEGQEKLKELQQLIRDITESKEINEDFKNFLELLDEKKKTKNDYKNRFSNPNLIKELEAIVFNMAYYGEDKKGNPIPIRNGDKRKALENLKNLSVEEIERINKARTTKRQAGETTENKEVIKEIYGEKGYFPYAIIKRAITLYNQENKENFAILAERLINVIETNKEAKKYKEQVEAIFAKPVHSLKSLDAPFLSEITDDISDNYKDIDSTLFTDNMLDNQERYIQNELLRIKLAILKHPSHEMKVLIEQGTTYGEIVDNDGTGGILERITNKKKKPNYGLEISYLSGEYQKNKYVDAQAGAKAIGVFATTQTLIAQLQNTEAEFIGQPYRFGDKTSTELNSPYTVNGNYKSDVNGANLSVSVDNEKIQALGQLNVNKDTFNNIVELTLRGFDENLIYNFINQDVITEYLEEYNKLIRTNSKNEAEFYSLKNLLKRKKYSLERDNNKFSLDKTIAKSAQSFSELFNLMLERADELAGDVNDINSDELFDLIGNPTYTNYAAKQIMLLAKFLQINRDGREIMKIQNCINVRNKGIPKSLWDCRDKIEQIVDILKGNLKTIKNAEQLLGDFDVVSLEQTEDVTLMMGSETFHQLHVNSFNNEIVYFRPKTIAGHNILNMKRSYDILSNYYPEMENDYFNKIFNEIDTYLPGINKSKLFGQDKFDLIMDEIKSYTYSLSGLFNIENVQEKRKSLLVETPTNKSLATILEIAKANPNLKDNLYLKSLTPVLNSLVSEDVNIYYLNNNATNNLDNSAIDSAFIELFGINVSLGEINGKEYTSIDLAKDLVAFQYLNLGYQTANNSIKHIPFVYLDSIKLGKKLYDLNFEHLEASEGTVNSLFGLSKFFVQFVQHYPEFVRGLRWEPNSKLVQKGSYADINVEQTSYSNQILSFTVKEPENFQVRNSKNKELEPFLKMGAKRDRKKATKPFDLYTHVGNGRYVLIPTLGLVSNNKEYFHKINEYNPQSLEKWNTSVIPINTVSNVKKIKNLTDLMNNNTQRISEFISFIVETSKDPIIIGIATEMYKSSKKLEDAGITIKYIKGETSFKAGYNESTKVISLSLNNLNDDFNSFAESFLHELTHAITTSRIEMYLKYLNGDKTDFEKLTQEEREAIIRLANLREEFLSEVPKEEIERVAEKVRKGEKLKQSELFAYQLSNLGEFASAVFNKDFQKRLAEKPYRETSSTLWTYLKELVSRIAKIVNSFLGVKESGLNSAIEDILILSNTFKSAEYKTNRKNMQNPAINVPLNIRAEEGKDFNNGFFTQRDIFMPDVEETKQMKNIRVLLRSQKNLLNDAEKSYRLANNIKDSVKYKNKRQKIEHEIRNLEKKGFIETMLQIGNYTLSDTEAILKNSLTETNANYVERVKDFWKDAISNLLTEEDKMDENILDAFKDFEMRANEIEKDFILQRFEVASRNVEAKTGQKYDFGEAINLIRDFHRFEGAVLDISRHSSLVCQTIGKNVMEASHNIASEYLPKANRLKTLFAKVNKKDPNWKDKFLEKYKNGKETGEFIWKISPEFTDRIYILKRQISEAKGKREKAEASQALMDFMNVNTISLDPNILFPDDLHGKSNVDRKAYLKTLEKEYGKGFEDKLEKARVGIERYKQDYEAAKEDIENNPEYIKHEANGNPNRRKIELAIWVLRNSPYVYGNFINSGKYKIEKYGITIYPEGYKYFENIPLRRRYLKVNDKSKINRYQNLVDENGKKLAYNNRPLTKWYNSEFENVIENDEDFLELYKEMFKVVDTVANYLPDDVAKNINPNMLPFVKKTLMDIFSKNGFGAALKESKNNLQDILMLRDEDLLSPDDKKESKADPNMKRKTLPIKGVKENREEIEKAIERNVILFEQKTGRKPISVQEKLELYQLSKHEVFNEKSGDIEKLLLGFLKMGITYKYYGQIINQVEIVKNIFYDARETEFTNDNLPVINKESITGYQQKQKENSFVHIRKMLSYIDDVLHDKKVDTKQWKAQTKVISPRNKKKIENLEELLKINQNNFDNDFIDEEEYNENAKKITEQIEKIGGVRARYLFADRFLWFVHLLKLGWAGFNSINNLIVGYIDNVIEAQGGEVITTRQFCDALKDLANIKDKTAFKKVDNFVKLYGAEPSAIFDTFDTLKFKGKFKYLEPYAIAQFVEKLNQYPNFIAIMRNTMIEGYNNVSFLDALNEDGTWNTKDYGESQEKLLLNVNIKMRQYRDKIHGNYDPLKSKLMHKGVIGRMTMMFRNWMPEAYAKRFESKKYDSLLGSDIKGRYVTYRDVTKELGFAKAMKNLGMQMGKQMTFGAIGKDALSDISDKTDVANMKKNATEMLILMNVLAATLLLSLSGDDDDKSKAAYTFYVLNLLGRIRQDTLFYVSPSDATKFTQNILPAVKTATDISNLGVAVVKALQGNDIILTGINAHESRLTNATFKLIPLLSSVAREENVSSQQY